ncbi:MAG: hypothetical protein KBI32_05405 [Phycisphaerae bacterium]|nr:hypothetical protein [Phycisphaerae bacterium]
MDSIWVKIAGAAVVVVLVIIVLGRFTGSTSEPSPAENDKTFYDMADRDKQFGQAPKPAEPVPEPVQQPAGEVQVQTPGQEPQPTVSVAGVVLPSSITRPTTLHFIPLDETEDVAAQQLLPWAVAGRSIGRLPMMQYGPMVKACRDILQRWPDSWYAFRAKQMLEEISERHGAQYNIMPQELDISRFLKPRRGTEPATVEPVRR